MKQLINRERRERREIDKRDKTHIEEKREEKEDTGVGEINGAFKNNSHE